MLFIWDTKLETGDITIDAQHKQLVNKYNWLYSVCTVTSDLLKFDKVSEVTKVLNFLQAYTAKHFADEEAILLKCNFPDYENHKLLHEEFLKRVDKMSEMFKKMGFTEEFAKIVYSQIGIWLVEHLNNEDSKIATYLNKS